MKILMLAPYVYAPAFEEHCKNKTGFGFMVYDIAKSVGEAGNDVVAAVHAFGPERECENFKILKNNTLSNIIFGNFKSLSSFYRKMRKNDISFKSVLRYLYYYLNIGYLKHLIKKEKPDIVHIHGCSVFIDNIMDMLNELNVPYVITLHGLLQYDVAGGSKFNQLCEKSFVQKSAEEQIPMTVISSGMKDDFLSNYYGAKNNSQVHVVTNGIDVTRLEKSYSIHEKHNIPSDKKIILCVGSICPTKNQQQLIRSFYLMSEDIKKDSVLLLVGSMNGTYSVSEEIEKLSLQDKVFCTGFVPREELKNYYSTAHVTACASIVEGFGISMVESFVYGTPTVAFSDIQAIPDIYNEDAMLLCHERSDTAFASALEKALMMEWNKTKIQEHSRKFSLQTMAQKYISVYNTVINNSPIKGR